MEKSAIRDAVRQFFHGNRARNLRLPFAPLLLFLGSSPRARWVEAFARGGPWPHLIIPETIKVISLILDTNDKFVVLVRRASVLVKPVQVVRAPFRPGPRRYGLVLSMKNGPN